MFTVHNMYGQTIADLPSLFFISSKLSVLLIIHFYHHYRCQMYMFFMECFSLQLMHFRQWVNTASPYKNIIFYLITFDVSGTLWGAQHMVLQRPFSGHSLLYFLLLNDVSDDLQYSRKAKFNKTKKLLLVIHYFRSWIYFCSSIIRCFFRLCLMR